MTPEQIAEQSYTHTDDTVVAIVRELQTTITALQQEKAALRGQLVSPHERRTLEDAAIAATLRAEQAERERDAWMDTAREFSHGLEFYRGIVQQTGAHFGPAAYTSDDGSVQDSVLTLKVPELAEQAEATTRRLREALERARSFVAYVRHELAQGQIPSSTFGDEQIAAMDAALAGTPEGQS